MENVTVKLPDTTIDSLEDIAREEYDGNRSDAIRDLLRKGMVYDNLEAERERLQRQLAATNQRVDEHQELVEYVEEQREIERQREAHEQRRREANVFKRGWWWLAGEPSNDE